jgi:hypothetical protein
MNRLTLFCLNRSAEIFVTYVDVPSLMNFLLRTGRPKIFSILAVKGNKSLFIDRIDNPRVLESQLIQFSTKTQ